MKTSEKRAYIAPKSATIEVKYEIPIASQGAEGGTGSQGGGRETPAFPGNEW